MKSIYEYLSYRDFLKDRIKTSKQANPKFSYRYFSLKSGLKSPSYLKLVIDGKRNIGKKIIYNICKGFELSEHESKFFEYLVYFNQAKAEGERNHYHSKLVSFYPIKYAKLMDEKHYKVFSNWYYAAICELVRIKGFKSNPLWISQKLKPHVSSMLVKKAIDDLVDVGLLAKDVNGKIKRSEHMLVTSDKIRGEALMQFYEEISELSLAALRREPISEKEYSSITVAIPRDKIAKIKEKIKDFRKELHSYLENTNEEKEDVVHLSIQLFSMTHGGDR